MSNTPVPAPAHFIQNVHHLPVGSKVKVLGCIQSYDDSTATLLISHRPSIDVPPPQLRGRNRRARSKSRTRPSKVAKTTASTTAAESATASASAVATRPPHVSSEGSTYTLDVSIRLLLERPSDGSSDSLPPIIEGSWVNIIGYKSATGGLDAIMMCKVRGNFDLEAYENAMLGMIRIRETVEREVAEGAAQGVGVDGVNWGY